MIAGQHVLLELEVNGQQVAVLELVVDEQHDVPLNAFQVNLQMGVGGDDQV
jgi:hypothetical protein